MAEAMTPAGPPPGRPGYRDRRRGLAGPLQRPGRRHGVRSAGSHDSRAGQPAHREIVRRLNAAQPPALLAYAAKLAELAREQRDGRLRLNLRSVTSMAEALSPAEQTVIGEAFGVPVIDLFVSTEGLVGRSEPGSPVLTFASDTCLAECVDDRRPPRASTA